MVHGFDKQSVKLVKLIDLEPVRPVLSGPGFERGCLWNQCILRWEFGEVFHDASFRRTCCTLDSLSPGFGVLHANLEELWKCTANGLTHIASSSQLELLSD